MGAASERRQDNSNLGGEQVSTDAPLDPLAEGGYLSVSGVCYPFGVTVLLVNALTKRFHVFGSHQPRAAIADLIDAGYTQATG